MPFRKFLGGDTDDYFAEGIIELIVHSLSGLESLFVIARASTMAYAGRQADAQAIGRELGVRYVLKGSVHQARPRLRILTELADAETGKVIRADRHDGLLADLFDIQDRISAAVVREIAPTVRRRELQRAMRKHPDSLTAYDLVLQALDLTYAFERASFDRARGLLQQAIALDPHYAPAWSHASFWHMFRIGQGWTLDVAEDAIEAARCATAAIARDRKDATALAIQGHMLSYLQKDYETAAEVLDRAVRSGPSCAIAWAMSGATCGYRRRCGAGGGTCRAGDPAVAARPHGLHVRAPAVAGALHRREHRAGGRMGPQVGGQQRPAHLEPADAGREPGGGGRRGRRHARRAAAAGGRSAIPAGQLRGADAAAGRGARAVHRAAAAGRAARVNGGDNEAGSA